VYFVWCIPSEFGRHIYSEFEILFNVFELDIDVSTICWCEVTLKCCDQVCVCGLCCVCACMWCVLCVRVMCVCVVFVYVYVMCVCVCEHMKD
jgi:hypothetical protein